MDNNQQMNKKEQEQQSAEKLGKTVSRGAFDYATGGQWEKVRNAPVVGKIAQKAEDKTAKKFAKSPGGKATKKLAKKLDDAGVVDGVNKGLNAFGGSKAKSSPSSNPNINRTNNNIPNRSLENNPNSANTPRKNFAKNGLTDEGQEIPGLDNKEGAMRKSFDDIQKEGKVLIKIIRHLVILLKEENLLIIHLNLEVKEEPLFLLKLIIW